MLSWLDVSPAPFDIGTLGLNGSLIVGEGEVRLPSLTLSLDDQTVQAAAKIHSGSWLERPFIRLAIDASTLNIDALLSASSAEQSSQAQTDTTAPAASTTPDLSPLSLFDLTMDVRAGRITYQSKSIRQLKLLAHNLDGQLSVELKSANLAKGNIQASMNGNIQQLVWNGTLAARGLDIAELAKLAGQDSPLSGTLSSDLNLAAQGLETDQLLKNGNIAGIIALDGGQLSLPALQSAIPNRESGTVSNLTSRVTINGLDSPADIKGQMDWNGERISYASTIGLTEALAGGTIPASLSVDASPVSLGLTGQFNPASINLSGSKLSVKAASSRALLAWLGQSVTSGTPDVPINLSTNLAFSPQQTALDNLNLQLGQTSGQGNLTYTASSKPKLSGTLALQRLDVTPFMGDGSAQGRTASAPSTASSNAASGWDTSPIDFSGLNAINADLTLSTQSLVARDIVTGPVSLSIQLQDGQLSGSLDQLSLYGGNGTGGISVDGRNAPATINANFALSGMQMRSFLRDSIELNALSGTGGVRVNVATSGASQAQIINQLGGTANVEIRDGQINGINIPQMLRSLRGNILEGWASSDAQTTDFSELTASFDIENGVVANRDLQMLSPLLRLNGAGTIGLPNQRIDYRATPKLISNLEGQGGLVDANGVPIPIVIKGKLAKPRIYPDIPGILENPQAILQGLEQFGDTGKAASKGIQKLEQNVTKELQKQTDRLGIDLNQLNQLVNPNAAPAPAQQNGQSQQGAQQGTQQGTEQQQQPQQPIERQLFRNITKGLFGN